jgi:hypothetical protein
MKEYLIYFYNKCSYEENDIKFLLESYEIIKQNKEAYLIVEDILNRYNANLVDNLKEYIIEKSTVISTLTNVHVYTVDFIIYSLMTKRLKELYIENNIDLSIYDNTVLDLKYKLNECKLVKGIIGSFVAKWWFRFFILERFALGRLQFEIDLFEQNYNKAGVILTPESKVVNVHIPRTNTPIDKESCDKSYEMAKEFFKNKIDGPIHFVCHSWLLFEDNKYILNKNSNTYRFMSEYEILESECNNGEDLWRLFDTMELDPNKLPTDSSFRLAYVNYLKSGKKLGVGYGLKKEVR